MKGRYNGSHMNIYGSIIPGAATIARCLSPASTLTERAKYRLKVLDWWNNHHGNYSLTARHFGYSRMTIYRWINRFKRYGISGLNEDSKRPKHFRVSTIAWETVDRVVQLRQEYPAWSKYKLKTLLQKEGYWLSSSSIGRILKRKGLIDEKTSLKKRRSALRPKKRFPRGMTITRPGQMIQMDTKQIILVGGRKFYQFTAIDVLTKRRVLRVYCSESSRNGALFLNECLKAFPYPVLAIQTDNGSCFLKEFDRLCKKIGLAHYFIYPRHPKQNSYVEISHGADEREFYKQGNISSFLETMRENIEHWEHVWNNIRPHESLNNLTPNEYIASLQTKQIPTKDTIILQT